MQDIANYNSFAKIEPLNKGWSNDRKYYIETCNGGVFPTVDGKVIPDKSKLLLRIADISEYEKKHEEFEMLKEIEKLGINASRSVDFGTCENNKSCYQLLTWIDGEEAKVVLPNLSTDEQYNYGIKAGQILKKMQTVRKIKSEINGANWGEIYYPKIERYIKNYKDCGMTFDGDKYCLNFIEENKCLLNSRPLCFTHDDFHPGNMIIELNNLSKPKDLAIIDFQRFRFTDPWHALTGVQFSADYAPNFARGQVNSYFENNNIANIPEEFWRILALYMAAIAINSLPYALSLKDHANTTLEAEIDFAYKHNAYILNWYDNFNKIVPNWYE